MELKRQGLLLAVLHSLLRSLECLLRRGDASLNLKRVSAVGAGLYSFE